MKERILDDRRVALEEAFFRQENERLRKRLRRGARARVARKALAS